MVPELFLQLYWVSKTCFMRERAQRNKRARVNGKAASMGPMPAKGVLRAEGRAGHLFLNDIFFSS